MTPETPSFAALATHDPVPPPATPPSAGVSAPRGRARTLAGREVEADTPLAFLLDLVEDPGRADYSPEQALYHDRMRLEAAKAAAPFVHPRLAQVEHKGSLKLTHEQALAELDED